MERETSELAQLEAKETSEVLARFGLVIQTTVNWQHTIYSKIVHSHLRFLQTLACKLHYSAQQILSTCQVVHEVHLAMKYSLLIQA